MVGKCACFDFYPLLYVSGKDVLPIPRSKKCHRRKSAKETFREFPGNLRG